MASCVRFVHAKYGVLLDGTQDTLSLLDAYVNEAREVAKEIVDGLQGRVGRFPPVKDGGCTWRGGLALVSRAVRRVGF